jgi:hypothetical protein
MSAFPDLTRDEAIALLNMTGGAPEGEEDGFFARHNSAAVLGLEESARAKLTTFVAATPAPDASHARGRSRCHCTAQNLKGGGFCRHPDRPNRPAPSTAVVRIVPFCHCIGEQLERGEHCDHPDCPNRPA